MFGCFGHFEAWKNKQEKIQEDWERPMTSILLSALNQLKCLYLWRINIFTNLHCLTLEIGWFVFTESSTSAACWRWPDEDICFFAFIQFYSNKYFFLLFGSRWLFTRFGTILFGFIEIGGEITWNISIWKINVSGTKKPFTLFMRRLFSNEAWANKMVAEVKKIDLTAVNS